MSKTAENSNLAVVTSESEEVVEQKPRLTKRTKIIIASAAATTVAVAGALLIMGRNGDDETEADDVEGSPEKDYVVTEQLSDLTDPHKS